METIAERARKCAVCGHEWVRKDGAPDPARCPNHKCRSMRWKSEEHHSDDEPGQG